MRNSEVDQIAADMLTEGFVARLHRARRNIADAVLEGRKYGEADLVRDLAVPVRIARLLMSFTGASAAEREMSEIIQQSKREARH